MGSQPEFKRPIVSDVQFEYKSARTTQGWPVESIKAGGLPGLVAYACFYASRAKRPELMGANQNRIGLDPDFCHIFWAQLPGFTTVSTLTDALVAYARSPLTTGDRTACLTVLDGLAWGLQPKHHYFGWLHSVAQVELLAGARSVRTAVLETIAAVPDSIGLTDTEAIALSEFDATLKEADRFADEVAAQGMTLLSAPRVDGALHTIYGRVPHNSDAGHDVPIVQCPLDTGTRVESLWGMPFEAIASAWAHSEARLFGDIPFHEWRLAGWDRARYEHAADGVRRYIDHYNAGALWVTAEVLARDTPEGRAATITRFVQVMTTLRRLHCFSALFQIATGLRRDSVARLSATWAIVPPPALEKWAAFKTLAGEETQVQRALHRTHLPLTLPIPS